MKPHHITTDSPVKAGEELATVHPATPEGVGVMLSAQVGTGDGRSEWVWLRLVNGDLLFGCFPQGDTYMDVTDADAAYPQGTN
jgi:hypothetical protein